MRIAYVINSVEGGGAAAPVPAIAAVLQAGGAAVRVLALTARDGRALAAMTAAGLDVRVRAGGERDHLAALGWLDAQLAEWGATHVWTSLTRATLLGQLAGRRRRLPVVSWQHAAYLKPANRWLLRRNRARSALWIGDSATVSAFAAQALGIPDDRLATWPIYRADADAPRAAAWQPGEPVRLGSLGRLHPVKGYDVLLAALRLLPPLGVDWTVTVAGEGDARAALACAAGDLGPGPGAGRVRFPGYADDPRAFLAGLHLYLQPSRSEGLCIAAHEAMTAGLPVVASAVGELARSIAPATGRLVPPGDPAALADALAALLRVPDRLYAMGAAGRARVLDRFGAAAFRATGLAIVERVSRL